MKPQKLNHVAKSEVDEAHSHRDLDSQRKTCSDFCSEVPWLKKECFMFVFRKRTTEADTCSGGKMC